MERILAGLKRVIEIGEKLKANPGLLRNTSFTKEIPGLAGFAYSQGTAGSRRFSNRSPSEIFSRENIDHDYAERPYPTSPEEDHYTVRVGFDDHPMVDWIALHSPGLFEARQPPRHPFLARISNWIRGRFGRGPTRSADMVEIACHRFYGSGMGREKGLIAPDLSLFESALGKIGIEMDAPSNKWKDEVEAYLKHRGRRVGFIRVKPADIKQGRGGDYTISAPPRLMGRIIRTLFKEMPEHAEFAKNKKALGPAKLKGKETP